MNSSFLNVVKTLRRARLELLASRIPVMDLSSEESLRQDSVGQLVTDLERLPRDREIAGRLLNESIELYPNVGYNQVGVWVANAKVMRLFHSRTDCKKNCDLTVEFVAK